MTGERALYQREVTVSEVTTSGTVSSLRFKWDQIRCNSDSWQQLAHSWVPGSVLGEQSASPVGGTF